MATIPATAGPLAAGQVMAGGGPAAPQAGAGAAQRRLWRVIWSSKKAATGTAILVFFCLLSLFPGLIAHDDPHANSFVRSLGPSAHHLLGTTAQGQDVFAQAVWGARQTMIIALVSGALTTILSVVMGVAAAYLGGLWDNALNLITDILLVIPTFPLLIVMVAYVPSSGLLVLIAVLVITGYSYGARQLRAQALSLRGRDYLEAAKVRGESRRYIIFAELIPSMTSLIVATFLGAAVYNVLAASGLQFIGLGDPNSLSWGTMLYWAQQGAALQTGQYLWAIVPGACIALLGAAFALLNYAFDEIGNPALQRIPLRRQRQRAWIRRRSARAS